MSGRLPVKLGDFAPDLQRIALPCWRKKRYRDAAAARACCDRLRARPHAEQPGTLAAYWCRHCGGHHVGHDKELEP